MKVGDHVVGPFFGGIVLMVVGQHITVELPCGLVFIESASNLRCKADGTYDLNRTSRYDGSRKG